MSLLGDPYLNSTTVLFDLQTDKTSTSVVWQWQSDVYTMLHMHSQYTGDLFG